MFLGRDYLATGDVSQPTLERLDAEVRNILDERRRAATAVLSDHRPSLDALARLLVERETLEGPERQAALTGVGPAPAPEHPGARAPKPA